MTDSNIIFMVNFFAALLTTLSFLPQAIKTIRTRDTSGISLTMYLMLVTGVFLWALFGWMIDNYTIMIANIITFLFAGIVLIIKVNNTIRKIDK
ncbi:MAG: MtN3 and saliva related transmembrane protein [Rickettsiales bacterium]|jgi:MtN3 and saliva related transmembrane protein